MRKAKRSGTVDPAVEKLWVKEQNKTFHPEEIREIALSSLARETDFILKEKIVAGPKEIDLAMITGSRLALFHGRAHDVSRPDGHSPEDAPESLFRFVEAAPPCGAAVSNDCPGFSYFSYKEENKWPRS